MPRDLETICLKCLGKQPEQRYASARELADDLGRFQRGEPVAARPVGTLGRLVRWMRRRPAIACLLAAILVVSCVGAGLSLWFGWQAQGAQIRQANERTELEKKKARLSDETREALEDILAESVADSFVHAYGPLSEPELDAVWELAAVDRKECMRRRCFELRVQRADSSKRLGRSAVWLVQAGVGLDPHRREEVLSLLRTRLTHDRAGPAVREACVELAAALGATDEAFIPPAQQALADELVGRPDWTALENQARVLAILTGGLEPGQAAAVTGVAARRLLEAITRTTDAFGLARLAQALSRLAERLAGAGRPGGACAPRHLAQDH